MDEKFRQKLLSATSAKEFLKILTKKKLRSMEMNSLRKKRRLQAAQAKVLK